MCRQWPLGEQTPQQELGGAPPVVTQPESDGGPTRCPLALPEDSSSVETAPPRRCCVHQPGHWPPQGPGLCSASRMRQSPCWPPVSMVVTATRPPLRGGGLTGPGPPSGCPVEALVCLRWASSCVTFFWSPRVCDRHPVTSCLSSSVSSPAKREPLAAHIVLRSKGVGEGVRGRGAG